MKSIVTLAVMLATGIAACTQNPENGRTASSEKIVGGRCEGCEAVLEYGDKKLTYVDTLPDFRDAGPKLRVSGTIYQSDGKTPGKDVILYVYHTDQTGRYPKRGDETGWAQQHGYIRGWIKTNADGKYEFYTLMPQPYPAGGNPAHIHPVIKEPGLQGYWIDEYLFEGDPFLTAKIRGDLQGRGGNGLLKAEKQRDGMFHVRRDIVLGRNVPGYE